MNDLIILSLVFFFFVRVIGLLVVIEFFYDTKDYKFKILIIAWSLLIISTLSSIWVQLIKESSLTELLLIFIILVTTIGFIFYVWGLFEFFLPIPRKYMVLLIVLIIIINLLLYITINLVATLIFSIIIQNCILASTYIVPFLKRDEFREIMGKSIRWYYAVILTLSIYFPISLYIFIAGYSIYTTDSLLIIMLYYIPVIGSTVLLIISLVHLEYSTSARQKFDLKDKYSHNLGNILQVVTSASDLMEMNYSQKKDIKANLHLIKEKIDEAGKLIKQIREL